MVVPSIVRGPSRGEMTLTGARGSRDLGVTRPQRSNDPGGRRTMNQNNTIIRTIQGDITKAAGGMPHAARMRDGRGEDHRSLSASVRVCHSYGRADLVRRKS